jgi:hypothetical protein
LLTEQHPVLLWLAERLMMLMRRGEAPLIASPHLDAGELLFCFIGQVSSRAGTPLIVDTHAVSYRKGGHTRVRPLKEALAEARFETLANAGRWSRLPDDLLAGFVRSAVEQSLVHLRQLKDQRQAATDQAGYRGAFIHVRPGWRCFLLRNWLVLVGLEGIIRQESRFFLNTGEEMMDLLCWRCRYFLA